MANKPFRFLALLLVFAASSSMGMLLRDRSVQAPQPVSWDEKTPVWEVIKHFGGDVPAARPASLNEDEVSRGRDLFTKGRTKGPDGKKTSRQSKFYVCTHCHNNTVEDPDLRVSDPEARLDYAVKNKLAFLQGTTLYGTVNKTSWYNGDYYKKYGDLVKPANKSLDAAIHLCATVCSQGRDFTEWEMKVMNAYFWSMELKLGDLKLSAADWTKLREAGNKGGTNAEMVKWVQSFYLQGSPATFGEEPASRAEGYKTTRTPDAARGKLIYQLSCMKCHNPKGPSRYLTLEDNDISRGMLARNIDSKGEMSLYHLVRHGTAPVVGHEAYMPHYPLERLNDQQVEDLRAYLEQ